MADWKKSAKQIVDNNKTSSPATQNNTPGANNSSGGWKSSAKQILDNVDFVAPEKRMYELKSDTKSFGTVSYGAYKAVTENKLHTYTPKNEAEKKILDEVKSYIGWKAPEDNTPLIISDYVPGAYNMTKNEYLRRQQSNPDMPEFGSYDYFKNREEKLRPILDEIANDADRTDDTYRAWAENYGKDNNWAAGKPVQKLAKELYEKFKYQDAILAEYKDIDAQLKKFDKKGIHYDNSLEIDTKSGAAEAKYAKERLDAIVNATTFTNDEMVMGVYGELPEEKQKEYDNVRVVAGQRNVEAEKEDAYDYYAKNKDNVYKDNLWGRITGNYKVGRIGIKANDAGFTSYKASTDDIEAVEVYQSLSARIQNHNNATFQNDNAVEEITAIVAQYAPQGVDQAVNKAVGSVVGAAVGWASGAGAGAGTGARLGGSAAVANYMYKQTAGATFVRLLQESDLSVEDAKLLAESEALASGAVEFGLDYVTSGLWKGVGSATKNATSELGEKTMKALMSKGISEKGAKTIISVAKNAGKLTVDALGEGTEEWIQEGMSITADKYAAEGKTASAFELFTRSFDLTQYSKEDFSRMNQSFLAGTIIGYGHGGLNAATSFGINKTVSAAASAVDAKVLGEEINNSGETQIVTDAVEMAKENTSPEVVKAVETVETAITEDNTPPAEAVGTVVKSVLTDEAVQETTAETEQVKNEIEDTSAPASVSVGDTFKDTKTGNTITVAVDSAFVDTKTNNILRVVARDAENTTFEIMTAKGEKETRVLPNATADQLKTDGRYREFSINGENTPAGTPAVTEQAATSKTQAVGDTEKSVISITKFGDFYEAYGDEALLLAEKLGLTPATKTINGEKVQTVGFPASALMDYQNKSGYMFSIAPVSERRPLTVQEKKVFTYDKSGKIRFKQVDINYDNYNYREDNFNILVQGKAEAENLKGGIVGKYGVHKKDNGYFGVTLLSSGMDVAAFSTFDEALSFATYTNKEVAFNDISYVRNAEGVLTIDATSEFMQYGEQIKAVKSEKAYLQTAKNAETSETVTSINSENMPVTDQNITDNDTVTNTNVSKAEVAESVTESSESGMNSQKAEEIAPVSDDIVRKTENSETPVAVKNTTADANTSLETKAATSKTSETPADNNKTMTKTDKKVAVEKSIAKKKKPVTKQNKAKITDFSDFPKVEDSLKEGQTLTLKHTKNLHNVFKDATRVAVGKDVITDGYIAIPRSDEAVSKIKKVVDESIIQYGDLTFEKIYKKDNDVVVSGVPKITDKIINGKKEKVYVFKIGNEFYTCQQKHLDALNDGNNTFVANKDANSVWTVKDENGEVIAAIVPAFKKGSISDEIYDRLDSVADVINAKNLKKAKMAQATLSQEEMNYFGNGNALITVNVDGVPFLCNNYLLLRTDEYTIDLMKEEYERDITLNDSFAERAATMFSQDIIGDVTKTANADVYKTDYNGKVAISEKTGKPIVEKSLTACLADDTPFCFDTKMFNMLDKASDSLKIIKFTDSLETSALIGFDESGEVVGYLCPVRESANTAVEIDGKQYKYYTKGSIDEKMADTAETDDLKNEEKSAIIEKDKEAFSETDEAVSSVSEYTKDMKPMQKGKVEKALNAPYQTKEYGLLTYANFMERSIADGRQLEERRDLKAKVRNGRNDFDFSKDVESSYNRNKAKYIAAGVNNFALAKEARELRENKTGGERIKSVDPELYYFLTGDESVLPESCFDKTYCVMVSDNEFYSVQKTAYDYGKWLEANGADASFSLDGTVEETKDLIAVHNVSPAKLLKTLKLGGFPMPSIAVARASDGFNQFGEISIVFDKNTIDPQASADNKIYGSDAWTPVYPSVEYEVDMDKAVGIYSRARKAGHLTFFNPVYLHQDTIENDINRYKGENGLVEHYKYDYGMKQFYLSEIGKPVDMVIGERTETLSEQEIEQAEFIAKELGKETILKIKTDSYTAQQWMQEFGQHYKNALFKYYRGRAKETVTDEQIWDIIDSKKAFQHSSDVQSVKNYIENGATRTETFEDSRATQEKIDSLVNQEEYEKWLADLFKGVVIKSGIRNNVDPYTEIGDRKSFDETHYAETLENVVRAMKEEEKQAGNSIMFSGTGLWGTAAKRYGSIDEVKSDSDRLVVWSEEKFSEVKRAIGGKLSDLADRIKSTTETNEFIARDDAIACILETISEAKTRAGMLKQLKSYYGLNQKTIDENVVQEIIDIVAEVQAMPTDYFEAKPQRAVGIDEIKAVIMPEQSSFEDDVSEIKSFFEEHNIPVLEYEYGDNNARIKALNSLDDVKFSKETEKGVLENETRNDATARSVGRSIGERADKSSRSLYETAGKAEENGGQRTDTASSRRIYAENVRAVQGTEVREQRGLKCEYIKPEHYTDDMVAIEESNTKQGIKTYFFFGDGRAAFCPTARFRGAIRKNEVYIQCDHARYSPEQINKHELVHRNYNSEDVQKVREYINHNLTEEEKRYIINVMYSHYAQQCKGDVNKVFEEFVCDVLAGMNTYSLDFAEISQEYWSEHADLIDSYSANTYTESIDAGGASLSAQEYADTFYSKMAKEIEEIKQDKIGAASVVSYLKGRGVKDEEIKWSGITEWLSDKKSVAKDELLDFVKKGMLQIETSVLDETINYTEDESKSLAEIEDITSEKWSEIAALWDKAFDEKFPLDVMLAENPTVALGKKLTEKIGFDDSSGVPEKITNLAGEILTLNNNRDFIVRRASARNKDTQPRWSEHSLRLNGGSNYRELLFKIPNSSYSNYAMRTHWGDNAEGIVAHARVQDFEDANGDKILFIEEIQSDWHNEGAKKGYAKSTDEAVRKRRQELESYIKSRLGKNNSQEELKKIQDARAEYIELGKNMSNADAVSDAPFRSTYHEFVIKNLLRMAAEQGYDKLAWTTGKMQEQRWSSDYAEAYRIEYDQEIPKFLNKYGKKWGAKVGITKLNGDTAAESELAEAQKLLDEATEQNIVEDIRMWSRKVRDLQQQVAVTVPAINITDAMRESILYEGQPMYSLNKGTDKIRYSPQGLRIPGAEYHKFVRAVGTDYNNKNKTHSGLQYQSVVGTNDHILYVYEDYGFDNYKIVGRVDYADVETANKVMELIDNGETIEITELVSEVSEWLKARQSSYSIYNAYTKKRRSSRGVHSVSAKQSRSITRGTDGSSGRDAENSRTDDISFSLEDDGEFDLFDLWEQKNKEFGTIKKGENPTRDIDVPKKITKEKLVSQFARTMLEAGVTPDTAVSEFEKRVLDGTMTHEVITNDSARQWAINQIKYHGFEEAMNTWSVYTRDGSVGKKELALGMELYNQCITSGDVTNAMRIAAELVAEATHAGQTLQATRMLKLMTPDGQLYYLEKSIQKMNDEFKKKIGEKYEDIELNEDLMEKFLTEKDADKRDEIYDAICQDIADKIPATLLDKWNSWRYLAMLGNPRTHIRNIAGNAVFTPAIKLKNYIGAIIERIARVDESKRTKSLYKSKEAVEFAKNDFSKMQRVLQGENAKYAVTSDIEGKRTIFKTKWLEALRNKNFEWLEKEDMWFLKKHYVDALAQIITARKLDVNNLDEKTLDIARAYATREAQRATYRDANALAEALTKLQKKASHSDKKAVRAANVLIEGVMPFKKTPLNIAKQGVQYSPVGILTGVYKTVAKAKNGDMYSTTDIIDDFAKGLTGTAIMLLGTLLASLGIVSGGDDENKKKKEFDKMVGEQSFSLNIGDSSYTIDWMTPACLPLFTGVELYELTKDDFKFADIVNALSSLTDPLLELSVFSGISGAIESAQYNDTNTLFAIGSDMTTSYLTQALPTIGGQLSRIVDKNKREYYYTDKNSNLPKGVQNFIGQVSSKIPFASYLFEPSIDEWGREETYGSIVERTLENAVSPGYYSEKNYTEVDEEIKRLYESTGEADVLPVTQQKKYTESKVDYPMTAAQWTEAKRLRGQKSFELIEQLFSDKMQVKLQNKETGKYRIMVYSLMSDEEKVRAIKKCYEDAGDYTKEQMLDKVKGNSKK
ncbi:MAG: hypothetical protein IJ423_05740 [Clostridia bacterium]|nr:hypothetical protein [Clostridia bacterium]MBQ8637473.1 hypothetical protein [Clostridia bacterium]